MTKTEHRDLLKLCFCIWSCSRSLLSHPLFEPLLPDNKWWILMCSIYTRFCFPCKYFVSISQQICQGETQHRNAFVGSYRGSAFLSFVLFIAAASKCPFFISHLVVWGVTVKASHTFLPHAPSSLPSLTARTVFWRWWGDGRTCTLFNAHAEDNGPLDLLTSCGKRQR